MSTLATHIRIFRGDITLPQFSGLDDDEEYRALVASTDSVIHCAASLNRKSEKSCIERRICAERWKSRNWRVARTRGRGCEDSAWSARSLWLGIGKMRWSPKTNPSIGTVPITIRTLARRNSVSTWCANYCPTFRSPYFAPASCLVIAGKPETTQFDMVRAFVFLAGLRQVLPFRGDDRN